MDVTAAATEGLAQKAAREALAAGRDIFTPALPSLLGVGALVAPVATWAETVEAIEAEGWRLHHWTVCQSEQGRATAYPLFRRDG